MNTQKRICIFGTGVFYGRYKQYLDIFDIICLIDNNVEKQGNYIDDKLIEAPEAVDYSNCDYVVLLVKDIAAVSEQLTNLGVETNKIVPYTEMKQKFALGDLVYDKGNLGEWKKNPEHKSVLIVVHELSRTGVPVAAMHTAKFYRGEGYDVLIASMRGGTLRQELEQENFSYIESLQLYNREECIELGDRFDIIQLGTLCVWQYGTYFAECKSKIVWWIHETIESMFDKYELPQDKNIHYFGGGHGVISAFRSRYLSGKMDELLYYLPEEKIPDKQYFKDGKITFALVGSFCERKGQDIFLEAIEGLDTVNRKKCRFLFVGNPNTWPEIDISRYMEQYAEIQFIGELSEQELKTVYRDIDVLVCSSRNDTMPIVVTQGMQNKCACIVSNEVGQAYYIEQNISGIVYQNESVEALTDSMTFMIEHKEMIPVMGQASQKIFESHFSQAKFYKQMRQITENM